MNLLIFGQIKNQRFGSGWDLRCTHLSGSPMLYFWVIHPRPFSCFFFWHIKRAGCNCISNCILYQVIANFYKRIYSLYYMIVMAEQIIHKSVLGEIWWLIHWPHRLLNSMELWSGYFYVLKFCSVLFLTDEEHFLNQLINLNYLGISGTVFFVTLLS